MKQKTATFVIYEPFGTNGVFALNIEYRRSCLWSFSGVATGELIQKAMAYTKTLGFTNFKIRDISSKAKA